MPPNFEITQKSESFACDTTMPPPPILIRIKRSLDVDVMPKPKAIGPITELVMIIDEVVEPCAVFKIAAIAKAKNKMPVSCNV